jgi:excisionase family DNA binding protein
MVKAKRDSDVLTVSEIAALHKVCLETIIELIKAGEIQGYKIGHLWRVSRKSLDDYITTTATGFERADE